MEASHSSEHSRKWWNGSKQVTGGDPSSGSELGILANELTHGNITT